MGVFPNSQLLPLVHIHTMSVESLAGFTQEINNAQLNTFSSAVFPLANRAIFVPFFVGTTVVVQKLFVVNGATVSGNIDLGIYTLDGTNLVSAGSTPQAGTSAVQSFSVSLELAPGQYYFAIAMDNNIGTVYRYALGNLAFDKIAGLAQTASAFPLPSSATLATLTSDYIPLIGLSTRSVV